MSRVVIGSDAFLRLRLLVRQQRHKIFFQFRGTAQQLNALEARLGRSPTLSEGQTEAGRWRTLAAEARIVATQLHDPNSVRIMLRIAEGYDHLAERAEELLETNKERCK
jgi:hypothetical protein